MATSAMLMRRYAPGVAFVAFERGPGEFEVAGLMLAGKPMRRKDRASWVREENANLRLASAYVCCGQAPPSALALKSMMEPSHKIIEEEIIEAFKLSLQALKDQCDVAIYGQDSDSSLKM